jgi:hypothetical protein
MRLPLSSSFVLLALLTSCASDTQPPPASPDAGAVPLIYFATVFPPYIASDLEANIEISYRLLTYDHQRLSFEQARQTIADAAVVETYPGQKAVQGSWEFRSDVVVFKPVSPLSVGDYLVRFPSASKDFKVYPRPYNLLRVGSLLRVAGIDILPNKKTGNMNLTRCSVRYSEPPNAAASTITIEQHDGTAWVSLGWSAETVSSITGVTPVDLMRRTRVTVTSAALDGKWTGIPGSGPFSVEFTPADFGTAEQVEFPVPPTLSVDLPSGKTK